jgi:hypothetical protein
MYVSYNGFALPIVPSEKEFKPLVEEAKEEKEREKLKLEFCKR